MEFNLEDLKKELDELEKKLEIEIDGRASWDELQKLRKDIKKIKKEINTLERGSNF